MNSFRGRWTKGIMALALGAAVILALSGCGRRGPKGIYGVHWYANDPYSAQVEEMTLGRPIHVLEIVLTAPAAPVTSHWKTQKEAFEAIHAKGHALIIRVQADWGKAIPHPNDAYSIDAFVNDCRQMAEDLRFVCHVWQISNEMNILGEWGGQELAPEYYAEVYKKVHAAMSGVWSPLGPQRVLLGPVSPGGPIENLRPIAGNDYLARMLAQLTPGECGGFAIHGYAEPCPNWECGLEGFQDLITEQMQIIDGMGFRRAPVYITEFNKHMPPGKPGEEAIAAGFIRGAFRWLEEWNRGGGNHNIVAACWFVYPAGRGWDDYSLEYWRTEGGDAETDVWAAFQASVREKHKKGRIGRGGKPRKSDVRYFFDEFDGALDSTRPLPDWKARAEGRSAAYTKDGWLFLFNREMATTASAEIISRGHVFDDVSFYTGIELSDATTRDPVRDLANVQIMLRAGDKTGYALVFEAERNAISLRDRSTAEVIGDCRRSVSLGSHERFLVFMRAKGNVIEATVDRVVGGNQLVRVAEFRAEDDTYRWGWVGLRADRIAEVHAPFFRVAGPDYKWKDRM